MLERTGGNLTKNQYHQLHSKHNEELTKAQRFRSNPPGLTLARSGAIRRLLSTNPPNFAIALL
jgi:hypothetical protein